MRLVAAVGSHISDMSCAAVTMNVWQLQTDEVDDFEGSCALHMLTQILSAYLFKLAPGFWQRPCEACLVKK